MSPFLPQHTTTILIRLLRARTVIVPIIHKFQTLYKTDLYSEAPLNAYKVSRN